jgi:hypothetical protein
LLFCSTFFINGNHFHTLRWLKIAAQQKKVWPKRNQKRRLEEKNLLSPVALNFACLPLQNSASVRRRRL